MTDTKQARTPHQYGFGSFLSAAYTAGYDGQECPRHCADKSSHAYSAWSLGGKDRAHDQLVADKDTKQARTPGPWASNGQFIKGQTHIVAEVFLLDSEGKMTRPQSANAEFIVLACNAHDQLLADKAALVKALRTIADHRSRGCKEAEAMRAIASATLEKIHV